MKTIRHTQRRPLSQNPFQIYSFKSWLTFVAIFQIAILPQMGSAQHGLVAEYFNDIKLENRVLMRVESRPYLNYLRERPAPGINPQYFSTRWTTIITAPLSGEYIFSVRADDGVRLWIGEKILIDAWRDQIATTYKESIFLEKDQEYKLKVEYYNSILHSVLILSWGTPEDGFSIFGYNFFATQTEIPSSVFSVDSTILPKETIAAPPQKVFSKPVTKNQKAASAMADRDKNPKMPGDRIIRVDDSLSKESPEIAVNKLIKLKSVRFELSKCELLESSHEELDAIVVYMKGHPHLKIKIIGHTDYEGNWTANYTLSKQRTNVIADYLKANGIAADRLITEAMGESKPIVFDDNPQNREENRRVEFMLMADSD
jgi:outer membrane protein OmpA-like peptidoglycan-associated protein